MAILHCSSLIRNGRGAGSASTILPILIFASGLPLLAQVHVDPVAPADHSKPWFDPSAVDGPYGQNVDRRADNSFFFAAPDDPDGGVQSGVDDPQSADSLRNADVLADFGEPQAPAGVVSVQELRHPLSRKALGLLAKAEKYFHKGNRTKAMEAIQQASREPSAAPYVHSLLGSEYLKNNQVPAALTELREAVHLLPSSPVNHSNLGYALWLSGRLKPAEDEIRAALKLDSTNPKTRFLLGAVLLDSGSNPAEAFQNLKDAEASVPSAHRLLAIYYARHGDPQAARTELGAYQAALSRASKTN